MTSCVLPLHVALTQLADEHEARAAALDAEALRRAETRAPLQPGETRVADLVIRAARERRLAKAARAAVHSLRLGAN